jgi:arsenate reductase (thioredoxin)
MSLFETLQHRRGRVLFVSESNSCRDQMAEAFARHLGDDSLLAFSAGTRPDATVSRAACAVMAEKAVGLFRDQRPKPLAGFDLAGFDVIVNLGAMSIPANSALVLEPLIPSPMAEDLESHRAVRDRMETFVRFLIEHFRRAKEWTPDLQRDSISTGAPQTKPAPPPAAIPPPDASTQAAF